MQWFQEDLHFNLKITVALAFMSVKNTLKMQSFFPPEKIKKPIKPQETNSSVFWFLDRSISYKTGLLVTWEKEATY